MNFEQPEDIGATAKQIIADIEANTHPSTNGLGQPIRSVEIWPFVQRVIDLKKKLEADGHKKWTDAGLSADEARYLDEILVSHYSL